MKGWRRERRELKETTAKAEWGGSFELSDAKG